MTWLDGLQVLWSLYGQIIFALLKANYFCPIIDDQIFLELGQERTVEPTDSLGHLQIKDLPELTTYPHLSNSKYFNPRSQNTSGYMWETTAIESKMVEQSASKDIGKKSMPASDNNVN